MKRYVQEFAKDELKCCSEARKEIIEKILEYCEMGLLTDFQAIERIVDSYKGNV